MNARGKILSYDESNRENLSDLLDEYAHELAEKIRQDTTVTGEAGDQYALLYADLIDPKAQRASTEGDTP